VELRSTQASDMWRLALVRILASTFFFAAQQAAEVRGLEGLGCAGL